MSACFRLQIPCQAKFSPHNIMLTFLLFVIALPVQAVGQPARLPALSLASRQLPMPLNDIALLGSDDFQNRFNASHRLLADPLQSHDWIYRAQSSTDCEIAHASAQLLLRVQNQLLATNAREYQSIRSIDASLIESQKAIFRISRIEEPESTTNLLAVVQFEPREELALRAAIELMRADRSFVSAQIDLLKLCKSPRPASRSLGIWLSGFDSAAPSTIFGDPLRQKLQGSIPMNPMCCRNMLSRGFAHRQLVTDNWG